MVELPTNREVDTRSSGHQNYQPDFMDYILTGVVSTVPAPMAVGLADFSLFTDHVADRIRYSGVTGLPELRHDAGRVPIISRLEEGYMHHISPTYRIAAKEAPIVIAREASYASLRTAGDAVYDTAEAIYRQHGHLIPPRGSGFAGMVPVTRPTYGDSASMIQCAKDLRSFVSANKSLGAYEQGLFIDFDKALLGRMTAERELARFPSAYGPAAEFPKTVAVDAETAVLKTAAKSFGTAILATGGTYVTDYYGGSYMRQAYGEDSWQAKFFEHNTLSPLLCASLAVGARGWAKIPLAIAGYAAGKAINY